MTDTATAVDDPDFAERVRRRDPDALAAVTSAYLAQILRAARGAGLDPQRAEEVTQATFTTFIEAAPRFEGRSHVRTWLFGILYKKIAEARRDEQRAGQLEDIDAVVEKRFAPDGSWAQPPRPLDAGSMTPRSAGRSRSAWRASPRNSAWSSSSARCKNSRAKRSVRSSR